MNKKVLVTGGAGFIASHVVDEYVRLGMEVLVIDNLSTGLREYVNQKAQFVEADITNQAVIADTIKNFKPLIINHHAAHIQVGNSVKDPQFDARVNVEGLLNVMQAGRDAGVEKVIMASTGGAMYGNKPTPFTEEMKEEPLSPYGISKRSGELYLSYYQELFGIKRVVLRYSNVYGPRQNPHGESGVIAIFAEMISQGKSPIINGDGSHTRDYVYINDVVKANVLALDTNFTGELNIGTGTEISTNQVFDKVVKQFRAEIERQHGPDRPGEQVTSSLNSQKAGRELGWRPEVDFDTGVEQTVAWYRKSMI